MNVLTNEIKRSLIELQLGLAGALNITDVMEDLQKALIFGKVPATWADRKYSYFSKKPLGSWFNDVIERHTQVSNWTDKLELPISLWLSGLFNPMSFLTAVKQTTARAEGLPLDNMILQNIVTE